MVAGNKVGGEWWSQDAMTRLQVIFRNGIIQRGVYVRYVVFDIDLVVCHIHSLFFPLPYLSISLPHCRTSPLQHGDQQGLAGCSKASSISRPRPHVLSFTAARCLECWGTLHGDCQVIAHRCADIFGEARRDLGRCSVRSTADTMETRKSLLGSSGGIAYCDFMLPRISCCLHPTPSLPPSLRPSTPRRE